jgi:hypothetical protein
MRLFGGVLSTLSQSASSGSQKRRQEVEKRRQEQIRQRQIEDDRKRSDKLARLRNARQEVQIGFDERVVSPLSSVPIQLTQILTHLADEVKAFQYVV